MHYHMLSPVSRPLLKRCISSSGLILSIKLPCDIYLHVIKAFGTKFSEELKELNNGKKYNFHSDKLALLKKYLETVPAKLLQEKFMDYDLWLPVAEG